METAVYPLLGLDAYRFEPLVHESISEPGRETPLALDQTPQQAHNGDCISNPDIAPNFSLAWINSSMFYATKSRVDDLRGNS